MSPLSETVHKTCGNCRNFKGQKTPTGKWKRVAGECNGVVTLVAPMAYRVSLDKHYVWPEDDAQKCVCYSRLLPLIEGKV